MSNRIMPETWDFDEKQLVEIRRRIYISRCVLAKCCDILICYLGFYSEPISSARALGI